MVDLSHLVGNIQFNKQQLRLVTQEEPLEEDESREEEFQNFILSKQPQKTPSNESLLASQHK